MRKLSFFFLFFSLYNINAKSLRFKKIEDYKKLESEHFNIVFPENFLNYSQKLANIMEYLYNFVPNSLNVKPKKSTIYIKNQRAISNGGAFFNNMFFFICPPQNSFHLGTYDWIESLAVHEFRHVAQFSFIKKKLSPYIPIWFWEGDAVVTETALTKSGRGRIPYWTLLYKVNLLEKGIFSYSKNHFGSFKDPIPDHYRLGYFFVNYLRRHYGKNIIARIYEKTASSKSFFYGFENAIKSETRKTLYEVYLLMNKELIQLWNNQLKNLNITESFYLLPKRKFILTKKNKFKTMPSTATEEEYRNNMYPIFYNDNMLLFIDYGIGELLKFSSLNLKTLKIKNIYIPNNIEFGAGFSYSKNKIVWSEIESHPRWAFIENYVIKIHNLKTRKTNTIYNNEVYLKAPDISPDGKKIVALGTTKDYKHQLVVYDVKTLKLLKRFENPQNFFFFTPKWSEDGKKIITIKTFNQQQHIIQINYDTGQVTNLFSKKTAYKKAKYRRPFTEYTISNARQYGSYILYNACYNGIDNIYALDIKTKKIYQVTSRKYGAFNGIVSSDRKWIYFNDFTKNGFKLMKMTFEPKKWKPLNKVEDRKIYLYRKTFLQEGGKNILKNFPNKQYEVNPYTKYTDLYNYFPPSHTPTSFMIPDLGIDTHQLRTLSLNNQSKIDYILINQIPIMNNFIISLGSISNHKEKYNKKFIKLGYQKFFPIFELGFNLDTYTLEDKYFYSINGFDFSVRVPLAIKRYGYKHLFAIELENNFLKDFFSWNEHKQEWDRNHIWKKKINLLFIRKLKQSLRDIKPRWAQSLQISVMLDENPDFIFNSNISVPGIMKHHSLECNFKKNYTNKKNYFSRKKSKQYVYDLKKENYLETKFNYFFPILYLDVGFPGYIYGDLFTLFSDNDMVKNNIFLETFGGCVWLAIETYFNFHIGVSFYRDFEEPKFRLNFQFYL